MKLNKIIIGILLTISVFASDKINMNFKNLEIKEFSKIVAKILNKNILFTSDIVGSVDFESNQPVYTDDLLNILIYVLEPKGYTVIDNNGILRIIKLSEVSQYNMPIYNNATNIDKLQMVTEVFNIKYSSVDSVIGKIRHLLSRDAKIVTDSESNSLVITDFPSNIKTVKTIISLVAKDTKKEIQSVKLNNLQAVRLISDLKMMVKVIFNENVLTEKVSVLLNEDSNSIMFVGKKENVNYMVKYLREIDIEGSLVEQSVDVVYLKNADASVILDIINGVLDKRTYKDKNKKPYCSIDKESNSIILMGPKDEIKYYSRLITLLDIDKAQVYVQARIIEFSETKTKNIGIKYGLFGGKSSDSSGLLTFAANLGGNAVAVDTSALGLKIPSISQGLALGATINLLKQNGAADIVSEPSLLCINNQESSIYVGQTVSIKTGTTTTNGGNINDLYKREDIGLTLKVKPRISNGDKVTLTISTKLEDVSQSNGANGQPNTSKKDIKTTAIVKNGESIILGGYIKNKKDYTIDSVPLLGDLPLLGSLFRNNKEVNDKINLVIIVTPYIVPKAKDLTYIRTQLAKLKQIEDKYTNDIIKKLKPKDTDKSAIDVDKNEDF
jgi:general secretion pathway protein D